MKPGRKRTRHCPRGHLRATSCNRHGNCKACRNIRERAQRRAIRDELSA